MEKDTQKIFYSMHEVAEMFDITQTQLRHWEKRFPTLKPHRNRKGNRIFTFADLEALKVIYNLIQVKGLKIDNAVKELNYNQSLLQRNSMVIDKLTSIKATLLQVQVMLGGGNEEHPTVYTAKATHDE